MNPESSSAKTPDQAPLSKYFSQNSATSPAASFFDHISSSVNGPAMMTSVRESASTQDLFQAASSLSTTTVLSPTSSATTTVTSTTIIDAFQKPFKSKNNLEKVATPTTENADTTNGKLEENNLAKTPIQEEPIVCRIFASQEAPINSNVSSSKNFFDMLGTTPTQQPNATAAVTPSLLGIDQQVTGLPISGASSIVTSPDFPATTDGSYLSPLTPTGEELDSILNDDTFNQGSILHPSEGDRQRDAWIPSDRTRQALIAAATSPPGTFFPDRELLTMPGVVMEEDMVDTVHEMVSHYLGEAEAGRRNVLTANDVTQDERGLRELIQAGCFRAAVNLTSQLLTIYGQGAGRAGHPSKHTVHSIQLWFTRLALLVKLRSFSLAEVESEPFGDLDRPDLYFQFYPELYGGRLGSMVPFAFRLLLAELPQYTGKYKDALNKLHILLATVRKVLNNLTAGLCEDGSPAELSTADRSESRKIWKSREARVLHSIINCALYQKDYSLAVEVLELLLRSHDWGTNHKRALQSALGRVYLQLGDVAGAEKSLATARELRQQQRTPVPSTPDLRDLVDRGLMAVAQNAFQEAYDCFQKASALEPTNIMLGGRTAGHEAMQAKSSGSPSISRDCYSSPGNQGRCPAMGHLVVSQAIALQYIMGQLKLMNNMGVCLLYLGRLKEALVHLEGAVNNNPTRGLHESLLLNVCTLYELESSFSNQKKLNMLRLLSRYKGDGICVSCLKL
uniref:Trafficking protein particle complex subunit 12 n=1 Tax=Timema monikensis TaxID=170555 RepID=A0A7R9HJL7_9NEOP|nr:unnamed protein product [Timema monikensis]